MCGVAGAFSRGGQDGLADSVGRMLDAENHRGLDGRGVWSERFEAGGGIALGHLRLSIIDLSDASAQPMASADGRYEIVYNGELYNYVELREELENEGVLFATRGDTEVVLNAFIIWGTAAFARFNGMWAIALYDRRSRKLVLSRDRFGEKPLYYHQGGSTLWFASEIKAILAAAGRRPVNRRVAALFLSQFMLDADCETFFEDVFAVPPASYCEVSLEDGARRKEFVRYWEVAPVETAVSDEAGLLKEVRDLFVDSVRIRLRSDVPLGVLLSGGVDSSCIAAAMRQILGAKGDIHSISAISRDPRFSEEPFVDEAAAASGTTSHKVDIDISPDEALALLPEVVRFNDQPIASFSAVAHYRLMEVSRRLGIVVILSGQGADELLCGYRKYLGFHLMDLARRGRFLEAADMLFGFYKRGTVLSQFSFSEARRYLPFPWAHGSIDVRARPLRDVADYDLGGRHMTLMERQLLDLFRYSVPQLVHYEDRMSMAFCREIRLPFLDHRLVELLVRLAPDLKLRDGWTKWILRKAMNDLVTPKVLWRKDKQGFLNPQERWLKHDLSEQVRATFDGDLAICDHGLVDGDALRRKYRRFLSEGLRGGRIDSREIFGPLALEIWLKTFDWAIRPGA